MSGRCPRCDRVECDWPAAYALFSAHYQHPVPGEQEREQRAAADCRAHAVDWRKACLAARTQLDAAITLAVCEAAHVTPRPGQLYRFIAMAGCPECAPLVEPYQNEEGYIEPPHPEEQVAAGGTFRAIKHHGDISIIDDMLGATIAHTKSTRQAARIVAALTEVAVLTEKCADGDRLRQELHRGRIDLRKDRDAAREALRMAEEHVAELDRQVMTAREHILRMRPVVEAAARQEERADNNGYSFSEYEDAICETAAAVRAYRRTRTEEKKP